MSPATLSPAVGETSTTVDPLNPEETSSPFVDRWHGLVSTTNWEKGRIIHEWRSALIDAEAPAGEYSDEAWSRRVGTVSSQHVGRLRRVFERFDGVRKNYPGLYWSHFGTALEWPDPELWLEGAVQNGWSVSQMRRQRWESYGAAEEEKPRDEDIVTAEFDEDAIATDEAPRETSGGTPFDFEGDAPGPDLDQGPDFGDEGGSHPAGNGAAEPGELYVDQSAPEPIRPFEDLPDLPADLSEAHELFKLAIVRHRLDNWSEVSPDDVLAGLEGLKRLVLAPAEG